LEFVCQREELLRGISIVERAATSKESMQILEGIYIRAEGDHLHLAATDLELSIECDVPATVVQQGEAVLGSKVLSPIVRKLVGDQLVYRTSESGWPRSSRVRPISRSTPWWRTSFPRYPRWKAQGFGASAKGSYAA